MKERLNGEEIPRYHLKESQNCCDVGMNDAIFQKEKLVTYLSASVCHELF